MGNRPEELLIALIQLQSTSVEADQAFPIICADSCIISRGC
jgi:hypothetical protein